MTAMRASSSPFAASRRPSAFVPTVAFTFGRFQLRTSRRSSRSASHRPQVQCPSKMDHHQSLVAMIVGNPSRATRPGMNGSVSLQRIAAGASARICASIPPRCRYQRSVLRHLSRPFVWSTANGSSTTRRLRRSSSSRFPLAGPMQKYTSS